MPGTETVFSVTATPLKFGDGAALEAGYELARLGVTRALVVVDPGVRDAGLAEPVLQAVRDAGIDGVVFTDIAVEPTLASVDRAAAFARDAGAIDGVLGLGGGSAMDTAKVCALQLTHPVDDLRDYVNPPVGGGKAIPGPLVPLVMVPTTAGTGSEATTVAVLDLPDEQVKSGISHAHLRPRQALVDPLMTRTCPSEVAAAAGLDVVCHALESFLSKPFDQRPAPESPDVRPPYQGANPIADHWSSRSLDIGGRFLRRAVADPEDAEARGALALAASMAGIGFGSAGVHVPHACAYPIAAIKPKGELIRHGTSVIVTAPAAFRWSYAADPDKHHLAARLLSGGEVEPSPDALPNVVLELMRDVGAPTTITELGFGEGDVDRLVAGAIKQQRLLSIAPREADEVALAQVLRASL